MPPTPATSKKRGGSANPSAICSMKVGAAYGLSVEKVSAKNNSPALGINRSVYMMLSERRKSIRTL